MRAAANRFASSLETGGLEVKQQRSPFFILGSARRWRADNGGSPLQDSLGLHHNEKNKIVSASRRNQHASGVRFPELSRHAGKRTAAALLSLLTTSLGHAQEPPPTPTPESEPIIVSATRVDIPLDQSPASVSLMTAQEFEEKQIERVADALREIPGLSVVQSGAPGQLTSVFTRGLRSEHTQVLLDGIPVNQGLQGAFNFADLTTDDINRFEVVRGPQSTLYGPRALAGAIQIFTKQGEGPPQFSFTSDRGSYDTFRETLQSNGKIDQFDYSIGASRLDTDNARPNNQYRNTAAIADVGWSPNEQLRIATLFMYSLSDIGLPNTIFDPKPLDNFLTERWLIAPQIDLHVGDWWDHKLIFSYDHERQLNDPNEDGFLFATRALFKRTTVDYQNDLRPTSWLTITSGFFYTATDAGQERPFVLFGPKFISDYTQQEAGFLEATINYANFILAAGGRYTHFNQFGDIWTYRFAGSYKIDKTDTTLHASVATGFSPPSSQDKIFRFNTEDTLRPEEGLGWDAGVEQRLWNKRVTIGATYFHNDLSNLIGFSGLFKTLNLGKARTQGLECELRARPLEQLELIATYTYLDAEKLGAADITQPPGSRLPRRPRHEAYVSASYLWCKKLRTTISAKWVNAREELNFGGPNFDIEDYTLVNFAAEYEINTHVSVFGRVDNLTNEHYAEVFGFPALGRAAYGGLRVSF
jgi:vitamin B12 transporter